MCKQACSNKCEECPRKAVMPAAPAMSSSELEALSAPKVEKTRAAEIQNPLEGASMPNLPSLKESEA